MFDLNTIRDTWVDYIPCLCDFSGNWSYTKLDFVTLSTMLISCNIFLIIIFLSLLVGSDRLDSALRQGYHSLGWYLLIISLWIWFFDLKSWEISGVNKSEWSECYEQLDSMVNPEPGNRVSVAVSRLPTTQWWYHQVRTLEPSRITDLTVWPSFDCPHGSSWLRNSTPRQTVCHTDACHGHALSS